MDEGFFEHISNDVVKNECLQDFEELKMCLTKGAWKASLVLAGSLIEAILYDYIKGKESISKAIRNFEKRKMTLSDLLQWARHYNIIGDNLFRLADQIRDYRNAIHPNVYVRKNLEINQNIAEIGFNVLLETIRVIKRHSKTDTNTKAKTAIKEIISEFFSRQPSDSELFVYLPIIKKYGVEKGTKIIKRSLRMGENHA